MKQEQKDAYRNTGKSGGAFPQHTNNVGVMRERSSDVSQIKGPRSKVDGGCTFPKTIRPGTPTEYQSKEIKG